MASDIQTGTALFWASTDGPWTGTVTVCTCKRHVYQREMGGRECGCGGTDSTCPRPIHVTWDSPKTESHEQREFVLSCMVLDNP